MDSTIACFLPGAISTNLNLMIPTNGFPCLLWHCAIGHDKGKGKEEGGGKERRRIGDLLLP